MKDYKVNFSYENNLHKQTVKKNLINAFDYLFFWCQTEQSYLITTSYFAEDYLSYIKKRLPFSPLYKKTSNNFKSWWGLYENIELEKRLNSKVFLTKKLQRLKLLGPSIFIVENKKDLSPYLSSNKDEGAQWMIKEDKGYSGSGNHLVPNKIEIKKKWSFPLLLETYHHRVIDFGISYFIEKDKISFVNINFNIYNHKGIFKGGFLTNEETLFEKVSLQYTFNKNALLKKQKILIKSYIQEGAKGHIEIDSYVYKNENSFHLRSIVEVNYRKTFSTIINCFKRYLSQDTVGLFIVCHSNDLIPITDFSSELNILRPYLYEKGEGIIPLSPVERTFHCYLLISGPLALNDLLLKFGELKIRKKRRESFLAPYQSFLSLLNNIY